ncbi:AAEL008756-PA [Aedes aegypti]|uniref:AAEL008756-PA n=1 Tax=Aedes aegypti TaxID=7159 RepID=Q16XV6_AEDAE|nr:AAEL008756-PA [Aedes aegypti]
MMNRSAACVSIILIYCVLWVACSFPMALSCDSCGRECASACGTRHFRTCCFNYLRKRSSAPPISTAPPPPAIAIRNGPISMEQWLSKAGLEQDDQLTNRHHHPQLPVIDLEALFGSGRNSLENDIYDYELKDGGGGSSHEADSGKRNSIVASHTNRLVGRFRHHRLDDERDSDQQRSVSGESDPGRLQLLYEN